MSWILFTILAALIFALVDLFDKSIVDHELKEPVLAAISNGFGMFILFGAIALFFGSVLLPFNIILIAVITGAIYNLALLLYFFAMVKEEVSRFAPVASTMPVFVLLLAFIFLGERFAAWQYVGVFLIVAGAILISVRNSHHKLQLSHAFFIVIIAAFFFAIRNVLIRYITADISIWPILFWIGAGGLITTLLLLAVHHPHLKKRWRIGVKHMAAIGVVNAVGFFFVIVALSKGTASLVSALLAGKPLLTFIGATSLGIYFPKFLHEKITSKILLQKIIAVLLIVGGGLLII